MSTPWSSEKNAKYQHDPATGSYKIYLDAPGRLEQDAVTEWVTVEGQTKAANLFIQEKAPDTVEYNDELFDAQHFIPQTGMGLIEVGATTVWPEALEEKSLPPKSRYRVTMEVECYDITQVMSEIYRGDNALIQRVENV